MEGYTVDFARLILDYMTKISQLSQNYLLPYSNLLARLFQAYNVPLDGEECLTFYVPTINEETLKVLN